MWLQLARFKSISAIHFATPAAYRGRQLSFLLSISALATIQADYSYKGALAMWLLLAPIMSPIMIRSWQLPLTRIWLCGSNWHHLISFGYALDGGSFLQEGSGYAASSITIYESFPYALGGSCCLQGAPTFCSNQHFIYQLRLRSWRLLLLTGGLQLCGSNFASSVLVVQSQKHFFFKSY